MAFESGELAAEVIIRDRNDLEAVGSEYATEYTRKFESRLRICGLLRRAAFKSNLAGLSIAIVGASTQLKSKIVRATRSRNSVDQSPLRAG